MTIENSNFGFPNIRMRRRRMHNWQRNLSAENFLSVNDLILPIFITEDDFIDNNKSSIALKRYKLNDLPKLLDEIANLQINAVALFPVVSADKKDLLGTESYNKNNLINRALKIIKSHNKNIGIICDVALDPYTTHGHDGILNEDLLVDNDKTLEVLVKQALSLCHAGADIIAPSDMMDGRVGAIRKALDKENFTDKSILSYSVKYASSLYEPFRHTVGSKIKKKIGDKKNYQMDFRNSKEAILEAQLDIYEGADYLMVKPGMFYLDVIKDLSSNFNVPIFAYQTSGEYNMLKSALDFGSNSLDIVLESLTSFKRAGSSAILTYFALDVAKYLLSNEHDYK